MLFQLEDLHKSYGAHDVLRGVNMQANPGDRIGLVGRNGAGKTTIFRIVTQAEEPDRGKLTRARGLKIGLLEQQPFFSGSSTVREEALSVFTRFRETEKQMASLEHLMAEASGEQLEEALHTYSDLRHRYEMEGGFTYEPRAESVLIGLGFRKDEFGRPVTELSGGQKARLALAKLLLSEPDLLLLDEPTNHLDIDAVEWLEEFLADYPSAFMIVSHDRFLLDKTAARIIEVDNGRATAYPGNYSDYFKQREERLLTQLRQYEQQQELIARTEEFIRRNIAGQKTKQAKARRNMLERLDRVEAVRHGRVGEFAALDQPLGEVRPRVSSFVLTVLDLEVGYAGKAIAGPVSTQLRRGERLGIIGPNGSGKSTFLKTVIGGIEPVAGEFIWGANVSIGYYDQELTQLDLSNTVFHELQAVALGLGARETGGVSIEERLRTYLGRFLFVGDEVFKQVSKLSGGERGRLALAKLIYSRPNVLVLDEPTNHLDILSREALESALEEYAGTIICVSHDRYFLDRIATEILHFESGSVTHFAGSYSEYYDVRHHRPEPEVTRRDTPKRRSPQSVRAGAEDSGVRRSAPKPKRSGDEIEQQIGSLEEELAALSDQLARAGTDWGPERYAEIAGRQEEIRAAIDSLFREWEASVSVPRSI
jgi:ATP-binding cassette subfamily F protein 3